MNGFLILVFLILVNGIVVLTANDEEFKPSKLLEAAGKGDVETMKAAVKAGENIDVQNVNGWSAAMFSVLNGDIGSLHELIDLGINLNLQTTNGVTALMMAASQNDKEMVESLLAGNASPLLKTPKDETAYSLSIDSGRKVVALIIAEAAVLHGIESSNFDVQIEYLKHGAFIDIRNRAGYTPAIAAAAAGNVNALSTFIKMGADLNRVENDGWAAIHFAAVQGNEEMVNVLLKANAAPNLVTADGRTARSIAETAGFKGVAKLIPEEKPAA